MMIRAPCAVAINFILTFFSNVKVSLVLDNLTDFSCKLYSAADTILLGEEDQDVKNDLLDDLRRATLGFAFFVVF